MLQNSDNTATAKIYLAKSNPNTSPNLEISSQCSNFKSEMQTSDKKVN